ncbi:hypothetical protein PDJAM_G00007570 [Pangasius djambal]|uniref:Uncharacterized protein n=1 Tax=Pangasius djambal TaxID=1691987 RepID=A0ACC5XZI3_9TELE|nr:hypothetical protein [Pangasius djambal]
MRVGLAVLAPSRKPRLFFFLGRNSSERVSERLVLAERLSARVVVLGVQERPNGRAWLQHDLTLPGDVPEHRAVSVPSTGQVLEDLLHGKKSDLSTLDKEPSLKKAVQTTLELLKEKEGADHPPLEGVTSEKQSEPSALTATNIISSALEEMTESALSALESCCHRPTIQALHLLVQNFMGNKECSLKDSTLAPLAEKDTYSKVQDLFRSSNVILSKEEDLIQAQISSQEGHFPLILCIAIFGLASLVPPTD